MATKAEVTVEQITPAFDLAEGPHWDHVVQKLYFVDINSQKLYRLNPDTGSLVSTFIENGPLGVAIPVSDQPDTFVAGAGTDFVLIKWNADTNDTSVKTLATVDTNRKGTRWNDGKVDSHGRFWGGTMAMEIKGIIEPNQGSLYRIQSDLIPKKEISPVTISNGLAWSIKDDTFYYIDSPTRQVVAYHYNPQTGDISNKKVIFDFKEHNIEGLPDGMTIDRDGNLWVAVYGGGCVLNVKPTTGELIRSIKIPAKRVTSVTFGGPLLDTLYVTTATNNLPQAELDAYPKSGCLFTVKGLGVRGIEANSFVLNENV